MILNEKFHKKENKIMTGLFLFFSSLGVSAAHANTNPIPNLSNIVAVAPRHAGEEAAPFYANNIQLEPVDMYFCFSSTPPKNLSVSDLSFYTLKGGSGEGGKHSLTLNTNQPNEDGFYLYDNTSDYYKLYQKMGFSTDGGIFTPTRSMLMSVGDDDGGDTSACNGRNFLEKEVFLRAKDNIGVFNLMISAKNDAGDTISSDAGANNYMTVSPLNYNASDFSLQYNDFGKWNALMHKKGKHSSGAKGVSNEQWDGSLDYLFNFDSGNPNAWFQKTYNSSHHTLAATQYISRQAIDGSAFEKVTVRMDGGYSRKHHGDQVADEWWGTLTGISTMDNMAPELVSLAPAQSVVNNDGQSGNLVCAAHKSTNHWSVENLWNVSKSDGNNVYESLKGGIGLPGAYVKDPSVFWIQTIIKHYNNGSQHSYSCGAVDTLPFIGYDRYGNKFQLVMKPKIGNDSASIVRVETIRPNGQ